MEKFVRVECIEVEEMTKKEFMKKMLGKEEDSLEEGYLIKDESGHMGWISQSDFEKKKYMSCNALPYPLAYYMLQEKKAGYIRMPQWKEDVKIKAQFPDEHSKMTHVPQPGVPESFKVLVKELQSLCLDIQVLDKDGNVIELKEDEDAMDTFNLARMDADDDRHRAFSEEAEFLLIS